MSRFSSILLVLVFSISACFAQSTTLTLNDGEYFRLQRTVSPVRNFDFIINGGLLQVQGNGTNYIYFGLNREFTIVRQPGVENALTVHGAITNDTGGYVTPVIINSGTLNPSGWVNWNVPLRISPPYNPQRIAANWGIYMANQALPNGQGGAFFYEGPTEADKKYSWILDGHGSQWTYRYLPSTWERGGTWWDGDEFYAGTGAAWNGIKRPFALTGNPIVAEDDFNFEAAVKVNGTRGFTGQCPAGQSPVFQEGIAVGCQ